MSRFSEEEYLQMLRQNSGIRPKAVPAPRVFVEQLLAQASKPAKYRNTRTAIDGITFDSAKEAARWQELRLMEKAGVITALEIQPSYDLHTVCPNGQKVPVGKFTLDFRYHSGGSVVVEDVKSEPTKTQVYRLRKRIFEAEYGLRVTEV